MVILYFLFLSLAP